MIWNKIAKISNNSHKYAFKTKFGDSYQINNSKNEDANPWRNAAHGIQHDVWILITLFRSEFLAW